MLCGVCNKLKADSKDAIASCVICATMYHIKCLNLSREELRYARSSGNIRVCPSCTTTKRRLITDSTPIRSTTPSTEEADQISNSFTGGHSDVAAFTSCSEILREMQAAFTAMKKEMSEFTCSLNSTSEDIHDFRKEINDLKNQVKDLERYKKEVSDLRLEVTELRLELAAHQQRQFLRDVEISGVTEHKQENLTHTISILSSKLGVELGPHDIDDVRRVGNRGTGDASECSDKAPRPVVVTLTRRAVRDQLLRAARVRRGITTDKIEIPGNPKKIYINEHLTKENRILFSKARTTGKELKFKYIWTSNGNIFMRRSESSSVVRISSEAVLNKLKPDRQTTGYDTPQRS